MPATTVLPSAGADNTHARTYPAHEQTTPISLTPPPTQNFLDATDRLRLVKSNRKLGKLLGATPHILEMPMPTVKTSFDFPSSSSQEDELTPLPFTPSESMVPGPPVPEKPHHHRLFSHKPRSASLASSASSQIALLSESRMSSGVRRRESLILPKVAKAEAGSPIVGRSGVVIAECDMADMEEVTAGKKKGGKGVLGMPLSMPRPGTGGKGSSHPPMLRLTAITASFGGSRKNSSDVDLNLKGLTVQTSLKHPASLDDISVKSQFQSTAPPSLPDSNSSRTVSSDTSPVSPPTPSTPLTPLGVSVDVGEPPLTPNTPISDTDEMDEMDLEAHQVMMRRKRMDKLERHLGERVPRELVFPKMPMSMDEREYTKRSSESSKESVTKEENGGGGGGGLGLSRWRSRSKSRSRGDSTPRKSGETRGRSFSRPRSSKSQAISVTRSNSVDVHYPLNQQPAQDQECLDAPLSSSTPTASTFCDASSFMNLTADKAVTANNKPCAPGPLPSPVTDTEAPFQSHLEAILGSGTGSNSDSESNHYPPVPPSPNALSLLTDASDFSQARRSRSLKRSKSASSSKMPSQFRSRIGASVAGVGGTGQSHSLERGVAVAGPRSHTGHHTSNTGTPRRSVESSSGSHVEYHGAIREDDEVFGDMRRSGDSQSAAESDKWALFTHGPIVRSERKQGWSGQWNRSDIRDVMGGLRALR